MGCDLGAYTKICPQPRASTALWCGGTRRQEVHSPTDCPPAHTSQAPCFGKQRCRGLSTQTASTFTWMAPWLSRRLRLGRQQVAWGLPSTWVAARMPTAACNLQHRQTQIPPANLHRLLKPAAAQACDPANRPDCSSLPLPPPVQAFTGRSRATQPPCSSMRCRSRQRLGVAKLCIAASPGESCSGSCALLLTCTHAVQLRLTTMLPSAPRAPHPQVRRMQNDVRRQHASDRCMQQAKIALTPIYEQPGLKVRQAAFACLPSRCWQPHLDCRTACLTPVCCCNQPSAELLQQ